MVLNTPKVAPSTPQESVTLIMPPSLSSTTKHHHSLELIMVHSLPPSSKFPFSLYNAPEAAAAFLAVLFLLLCYLVQFPHKITFTTQEEEEEEWEHKNSSMLRFMQ